MTRYSDTNARTTVQKAVESGILNDTAKTHDLVDLLAKISENKGVTFSFTNNKKLKESGFALDGKTVNGYVTKDGVTINTDSAKYVNSVVGHEITHVLEGTELYNELASAITEYAKRKGDFDIRYKALTELYKDVKDADINAELVADLVGDYLFTDADFVNELSVKHRNVFQKIFDEIKYLCKLATAGSKEARQLEKAKKLFAKVYRDAQKMKKEGVKSEGGTSLSISKTSKMPYGNQLLQIEKGQMNGSNSLYVGKPSEQLQSVGFSDAPFAMNQSDYRKSRRASAKNKNYSSHDVPYEFFEKMPQYISDAPLLVDNGENITVITSYGMNDTKGNSSYVIAGVRQNQAMESDTVNQIKSVYPWDDFVERITKSAEEGKLVVTNKNKAEQMLATIGVQPSEVSRIVSLAKGSISQKETNVNTRYSLSADAEHIDNYTEKQYNDFGWARVNDALSSQENADFRSKFSEAIINKNRIPDTANGEYIIACGNLYGKSEGVNNKLVYAKGNKNNLQKLEISKVIEIKLDNETDVEIIRSFILEGERNGNTSASFIAQDYFGKEFVCINTKRDFPSYQDLKRNAGARRSGSDSEDNTRAYRIGHQRNRAFEQARTNEIAPIKASSEDGAFFDAAETKTSLSNEGETPKRYGNYNVRGANLIHRKRSPFPKGEG